MKKLLCIVSLIAASLSFSGCATGPTMAEAKLTIPPVPADKGRVFFYRTTVLGAAIQPDVRLNGEVVGSAKPSGAFYADRAPGNYAVESSTEVTRRLTFALEKGQTRYVRLNISMGFLVGHVYPELVEDTVGEADVAKCKFTGGGK